MEDGDADPLWRTWSLVKFNELETKEHARRAIEVPKEGTADAKDGAAMLPAGDATRGWHHHWRRGVYGALQSW